MKGIVFNLLEKAVSEQYGEDTWDKLLEAAGSEGVYTSLGSYPDAEILKIVQAASTALNLPANDILRWFGQKALPMLAQQYPDFFKPHTTTKPFLLTLNNIIHPEVRKLYPAAEVPDFDFSSPNPAQLIMGYSSSRKFCAFAEGLIQGAAAHFNEKIDIQQPQCMHRGDKKCTLVCSFSKLEV